MNSLLLFAPLAVYLLVVLSGSACVIVASVALKKTRAAQLRLRTQDLQPPLLSGSTQRNPTSSRVWTLCLKALLTLGAGALVLALVGAWRTQLSISYESKAGTRRHSVKAAGVFGLTTSETRFSKG